MLFEKQPRTRDDWEKLAAGGATAGIVAGSASSVIMLTGAAAQGMNAWPVLKGASAPFFGMERVGAPGFDAGPVLIGIVSHYGVSLVWALLFAALAYGLSPRATALAGAAFGVVVWVGMYYVALPILGLAAMAESTPVPAAVFNHILFGAAVGLTFAPFQRVDRGLRPLPVPGGRLPLRGPARASA